MKLLGVLLGVLLLGWVQQQADDKQIHFIMSLMLYLFLDLLFSRIGLGFVLAIPITLGCGIIKELRDERFSYGDLAADGFGILLGVIIRVM